MCNSDDMIEVKLLDDGDFLKIKETLQRMGVPSYKNKTLFQSCHILHKQGKYYIVHFKELFKLDGKPSNISPDDIVRRDKVIHLLLRWKLIDISNLRTLTDPSHEMFEKVKLKVIPYKERGEWNLVTKYTLGKRA